MGLSERCATGIPGLDEVLDGGMLRERSYLLTGSPGTGKTILSLQWLLTGARNGERTLYLCIGEPAREIRRNVEQLGWDISGLGLVDVARPRQLEYGGGEYRMFSPSEVEQPALWAQIHDLVEGKRPQRLVIDSLTDLRQLSTDNYQFRSNLQWLVSYLGDSGVTSLVLFEPTEIEKDVTAALAVDGVIRLCSEVSPNRLIGLRSLSVDKMRGSDFLSGAHAYRISRDGLQVFPHRIEPTGATRPGTTQLQSGIDTLDQLLGGGLESGTTTVFSGPTGVGKSTLGLQFLSNANRAGRAILYAFEESVETIRVRCAAVGIPVERAEGGSVRIERVNSMAIYPDEFLAMVRSAVEDGYDHVMVDSLRGYELAMTEFGSPTAHMHNLVTYLNRMGVTTLLTNEVEHITGSLMATEMGLSHLADAIILMRYVEYRGQIIKVLNCLKKRVGRFEPELREITISSAGIQVGEKLRHLQGVLTGVPSLSQD